MEAPTPRQCVGITIHGYSSPLEGVICVIVAIKIGPFGLEATFGPCLIRDYGFHSVIENIKFFLLFYICPPQPRRGTPPGSGFRLSEGDFGE